MVPDDLKIAKFIPVYKSDDKKIVSNYRPVSVLPAFSKILEKIVYNRLLDFINQHNLLSKAQYVFWKKHIHVYVIDWSILRIRQVHPWKIMSTL